ncbi:lipocalin family protein [Tamlana sp. I1]|uniref:lipocalin family protein n=1 Tax=Tamlana sp. I1 TaxID=2762061 RepID=UPI00188DDD33|nr:lipocalin family protein [Tamlana sp. I1]
MKKFNRVIILTVAVLTSVFSTSCSKDDDGGAPSNEDQIIGEWILVSETERVYINGEFEEENVYEYDEDTVHTITFSEDGTFVFYELYSGGSYTNEGTYRFDGDTLITSYDDDEYEVDIELHNNYFIVNDTDTYAENGDSYRYEYEERYERVD